MDTVKRSVVARGSEGTEGGMKNRIRVGRTGEVCGVKLFCKIHVIARFVKLRECTALGVNPKATMDFS